MDDKQWEGMMRLKDEHIDIILMLREYLKVFGAEFHPGHQMPFFSEEYKHLDGDKALKIRELGHRYKERFPYQPQY